MSEVLRDQEDCGAKPPRGTGVFIPPLSLVPARHAGRGGRRQAQQEQPGPGASSSGRWLGTRPFQAVRQRLATGASQQQQLPRRLSDSAAGGGYCYCTGPAEDTNNWQLHRASLDGLAVARTSLDCGGSGGGSLMPAASPPPMPQLREYQELTPQALQLVAVSAPLGAVPVVQSCSAPMAVLGGMYASSSFGPPGPGQQQQPPFADLAVCAAFAEPEGAYFLAASPPAAFPQAPPPSPTLLGPDFGGLSQPLPVLGPGAVAPRSASFTAGQGPYGPRGALGAAAPLYDVPAQRVGSFTLGAAGRPTAASALCSRAASLAASAGIDSISCPVPALLTASSGDASCCDAAGAWPASACGAPYPAAVGADVYQQRPQPVRDAESALQQLVALQQLELELAQELVQMLPM